MSFRSINFFFFSILCNDVDLVDEIELKLIHDFSTKLINRIENSQKPC